MPLRLIAALSLISLLAPGGAAAHELELSGLAGVHFFSRDNALGRADGDARDNAPIHSAMLGLRLGYSPHPNLMFEAELGLVPTRTSDGLAHAMLLAFRGHLLLHLMTARVRPFLLVGGGGMSSVFSSNEVVLRRDTHGLFHGGAGLKMDLTRHLGVRLDGRVLFPPRTRDTPFTQDYELLLSLYGRFGGRWSEPSRSDRDGDGVLDREDQCPDRPEDLDGFRDDDGCPETDNDRDGVPDGTDACPNEAGPRENAGCPEKDSDGDGVADRLDHCPIQPGEPQRSGCPDEDGDGVIDGEDQCQTEPETRNGFKDEDGCPDELPRDIRRYIGIIRGVRFATGKDELRRGTMRVLRRAARVLAAHPTVRVEISGHTDDDGDRDRNIELSTRRAEAVRRYLIEQGVEAGRLKAVGYGPDRPIADNARRSGRARNRRVEFALIVEDEQR